jgi:diacylglycerol kinase family enzyme
LLSNPKSTGNLAQLPRIRAFCAEHPDIFHYEVEKADQIGSALATIARIRPKVLVINGGDGTVQAALTEIHNGSYFGKTPPPVAVLPSGKTNLIAFDLGAHGDPIVALERLLAIIQDDLGSHVVAKELIALRSGSDERPVIGMFLGGAGLADVMLYCRHKIYPLGLPNSVSHLITAVAVLVGTLLRLRTGFLPPEPSQIQVSSRSEQLNGRFALLAVTTLERLLMSGQIGRSRSGALKLLAVDARPLSIVRAVLASLSGRLGRSKLSGVHYQETDELKIEGDRSDVILDGEMFRAELGSPILLRAAQPLSFVRLAA